MTQFRETIVRLCIILFFPISVFAQSTFLPQGNKYEHFLDRMEILLQTNPNLNITTDKPMSRKVAVDIAQLSDSLQPFLSIRLFLSPV